MTHDHPSTRWLQISVSLLLILAVFTAMLPQPARAAASEPNSTCAKTHTVKEGETLRRIARDHNVILNRLAKANNLTRPYNLTVGQVLCIPADPTVTGAGKFSVTFSNGKVRLEGTGFKKTYPFVVRVRENDTSKWFKLGTTQSDKNGKLSVSFNAPKELLNKASIIVCLKDGVTDGLVCKKVYRQ